jgi:hypothetical protein
MVDDSRTEPVQCRLFSKGASPVRHLENVTVSAQATFGRDGAMFDSFVGFIAQLSWVLWVLVVLTMIVRFVGIRIYRDTTRATPAKIAAVRSPQVQSATARTDAGRNAPLGEAQALQPTKRQTEVAGTTASGLAMHKVHLENRSAGQVRGLAANSTGA